jgi:hypothetical protein
VLAAFGRHEAPVLHLAHGLPAGSSAFLCQGIFSNDRSQPVIVEWFAVSFEGGKPGAVVPFEEFLQATRLHELPANPGHVPSDAELAALLALRVPAVEAARKYLDDIRADRAERLSEPLRAGHRKLIEWAKRRKEHLRASVFEKSQAGGLFRNMAKEKKASRRITEVDELVHERGLWIQKSMKTVPEPYIRLAAVLVAAPA